MDVGKIYLFIKPSTYKHIIYQIPALNPASLIPATALRSS